MFTENENTLDLGCCSVCTCIETNTEDLYDGMSIWRLDMTVKNIDFANNFVKVTKDLHENELAPLIKIVKNNNTLIPIYTVNNNNTLIPIYTDYYSIIHVELNKNILSIDFRTYNNESFDMPIKDFHILTMTAFYNKCDFC